MSGVLSVVLVGNVGTGKSSLVEKVTLQKGLSFSGATSFTQESRFFLSPDGRLRVIDTPGVNARTEPLQHNMWVAHALGFKPVSMIGLVVKADRRIDNFIGEAEEFAMNFSEFMDVLCIIVTHMDTVPWRAQDGQQALEDQLGLKGVFVGLTTTQSKVQADIMAACSEEPLCINIDHDNFFRYFRLPGHNIKVLQTIKRETDEFHSCTDQFRDVFNKTQESLRADLVYEFHTWCMDYIVDAQKRVSSALGFTFTGGDTAVQASHVANLANQMKGTLYEIRVMMLGQASPANVSLLKKCPYCGCVWMKTQGCDGMTTCGSIPSAGDARVFQFATFTFSFQDGHLTVIHGRNRTLGSRGPKPTSGSGCGKSIDWQNMAPVAVPEAINQIQSVISTADVQLLPEEARPSWQQTFERSLAQVKGSSFLR